MNKLIARLLAVSFLLASCVVAPVDEQPQEPTPLPPPVFYVNYELVGSYSAQFTCKIDPNGRTFVKGEFEYSTDPGFAGSSRALGLVADNVLTLTVSDIVEDNVYYLRAYVSDRNDTFMSETIKFDSPSFKVDQSDYQFGWASSSIMISVMTNVEVVFDLPESSWVHVGSKTGTRPGNEKLFTVTVDENPDLRDRDLLIPVHAGDGYFKDTLSFHQDCHPVDFADKALAAFMVKVYDKNANGEIELDEIEDLTELELDGDAVASISGLEHCTKLERLSVRGSGAGKGLLQAIDLGGFPGLRYLDLSDNRIAKLDISPCENLNVLICPGNQLSALETSANEPLETLDCSRNRIEALDLTYNTSLSSLKCGSNAIRTIVGSRSSALKYMDCSDNQLDALELKRNSGLETILCSDNNIAELNVNDNRLLQTLDCSHNNLSSLYLRKNAELVSLDCSDNPIAVLNVKYNTKLSALNCSQTALTELDVLDNLGLEHLDCSGTAIESLDVSTLTSLAELRCNCAGLGIVYVGAGMNIPGITHDRSTDFINETTMVRMHSTPAEGIEDPAFLAYLLKHYDIDNDGIFTLDEAETVTSVSICTDEVSSLAGVELLTGLRFLACEGSVDPLGSAHGKLRSLDLSRNPKLEQLLCGGNAIASLDLSANPCLRTLWCYKNELSSLDLSHNPELEDLNCEYNYIRTLDLSSNLKLASLDCSPMVDADGINLLKTVVLSGQRIKYINHSAAPRNSANIPSATVISFGGSIDNLDFMFNFNAKLYDRRTNTIPNLENALWQNDLVLSGGYVTPYMDYIRVNSGACMIVEYPNTNANPFNRSDTKRPLTIIAKVAGNSASNFSIFANRGSNYNYMLREGDASTRYFYFHDSRAYGSAPSVSVNVLPAIVAVRANKDGDLFLESYENGVVAKKSSSSQRWGGQSNAIGFFCGGSDIGEYWSGDFYWIFLSLEELSDEDILRVIEYNENL